MARRVRKRSRMKDVPAGVWQEIECMCVDSSMDSVRLGEAEGV